MKLIRLFVLLAIFFLISGCISFTASTGSFVTGPMGTIVSISPPSWLINEWTAENHKIDSAWNITNNNLVSFHDGKRMDLRNVLSQSEPSDKEYVIVINETGKSVTLTFRKIGFKKMSCTTSDGSLGRKVIYRKRS